MGAVAVVVVQADHLEAAVAVAVAVEAASRLVSVVAVLETEGCQQQERLAAPPCDPVGCLLHQDQQTVCHPWCLLVWVALAIHLRLTSAVGP